MLMPAAVLVLVILGSIAVDSAVAFLGQRELSNFTATAAATAASAGLDQAAFDHDQRVAIDPHRPEAITSALQGHVGSGVHDLSVQVTVDGSQVTVTASGVVDDILAKAIPGVRHAWTVHATSRATARSVRNGP
jgi:Flp pilus assembly protein TadG